MLMRREDIAQVGTIKDVFQCREDLDPDRWSIFARDESAKVVNFCRTKGTLKNTYWQA